MIQLNRASPEWGAIRGYINEQIDELRTQLEHPMEAEDTAFLRGKIKALRDILAAAQPTPALADTEDVKDYV